VLGVAAFQLVNVQSHFTHDSSEELSEIRECGENKFYSVAISRCVECGKCGSNMYEKVKCHRDVDTVCGWCLSDNPITNDDFFHECEEYIGLLKKFRKELSSELQVIREEGKTVSGNPHLILYALVCVIPIALVFVTVWMCCMQRKYTRVINVTPPQLSEIDDHNIIFAANQIREKFANKRGGKIPYEHL